MSGEIQEVLEDLLRIVPISQAECDLTKALATKFARQRSWDCPSTEKWQGWQSDSPFVTPEAGLLEKRINSWDTQSLIRSTTNEVPEGILPANLQGSISDIRVAGGGPDDELYARHQDLRLHLPRGTSILNLRDVNTNHAYSDVVIYANRKFYGGFLDDDDDLSQKESLKDRQTSRSEDGKQYFLSSPENTTKVLAMEKINGEAAHFSGRLIDGQFYLIAGSKNVHLLFRSVEDIDKYLGQRYLVAREIAKAVYKIWRNLEKDVQLLFSRLLHATRGTVVCELLQPNYQHVVLLDHLEEPRLVTIMLTPPPAAEDEEPSTLTLLPPVVALQVFRHFGLHTPQFQEFTLSEEGLKKEEVQHAVSTEGRVFYYIDSTGSTIGLLKVKSAWYIILRALREKTCSYFSAKQNNRKKTIDGRSSAKARIKSIQEWLRFSDGDLEQWLTLTDAWFPWVDTKVTETMMPKNIRGGFPRLWNEFFLDYNKLPDSMTKDAKL